MITKMFLRVFIIFIFLSFVVYFAKICDIFVYIINTFCARFLHFESVFGVCFGIMLKFIINSSFLVLRTELRSAKGACENYF